MARGNDAVLFGALCASIALYLYSRSSSGARNISQGAGAVIDAAGQVMSTIDSTVRGLRNNNPGNIRRSGEAWIGLSPTQDDPAFFQFSDIRYGIRAIGKLLLNYGAKYGLNTTAGIISRWAPSSENDTRAYIAAVATSVGVDPNQPLDLTDPVLMAYFIDAIIQRENGSAAAALIPASVLDDGVQLALT